LAAVMEQLARPSQVSVAELISEVEQELASEVERESFSLLV
jgi:hypothetical protein